MRIIIHSWRVAALILTMVAALGGTQTDAGAVNSGPEKPSCKVSTHFSYGERVARLRVRLVARHCPPLRGQTTSKERYALYAEPRATIRLTLMRRTALGDSRAWRSTPCLSPNPKCSGSLVISHPLLERATYWGKVKILDELDTLIRRRQVSPITCMSFAVGAGCESRR